MFIYIWDVILWGVTFWDVILRGVTFWGVILWDVTFWVVMFWECVDLGRDVSGVMFRAGDVSGTYHAVDRFSNGD